MVLWSCFGLRRDFLSGCLKSEPRFTSKFSKKRIEHVRTEYQRTGTRKNASLVCYLLGFVETLRFRPTDGHCAAVPSSSRDVLQSDQNRVEPVGR
jgi:hypothetical protein